MKHTGRFPIKPERGIVRSVMVGFSFHQSTVNPTLPKPPSYVSIQEPARSR